MYATCFGVNLWYIGDTFMEICLAVDTNWLSLPCVQSATNNDAKEGM